MIGAVVLWSHALAAVLFGAIALSQFRRAGTGVPRLAFTAALVCTALWALAVAGIGANDITAHVTESLCDLAWLAFMFALARRGRDDQQAGAISLIYGIILVITVAATTLDFSLAATIGPVPSQLAGVATMMRLMVAVSALVLVNHLHDAVTSATRHDTRLVLAGLALFWAIDLVFYTAAYFSEDGLQGMVAVRGLALVVLAPLFALAVHRGGDWSLQVSRTVAYQSLSLAAVVLYVALMTVATALLAGVGGTLARIVQTAFVFGATATMLTLISTPWLRAWTRVKLAKHLFRHRYDYRSEWARFAETLSRPDANEAALEQRIVKAVADVTDSPAGLLLTPDGASLGVTAAWNWSEEPQAAGDEGLARYLEASGRVIELDSARAPSCDLAERSAIPSWLLESSDAGH